MNIINLFSDDETETATEMVIRRPVRRMRRPTIYFGGRMNGCRHCEDWRNAIPGFAGFDHLLGGVDDEVAVEHDTIVNFGAFRYGGPFAIDTASGHATGHADDPVNRERVWHNDSFQSAHCDLFVAWIDDLESYGTLVEVGYAAALGKPIALGFCDCMPREDYRELWFARMAAWKIYRVATPGEFWAQVVDDWIAGGRA